MQRVLHTHCVILFCLASGALSINDTANSGNISGNNSGNGSNAIASEAIDLVLDDATCERLNSTIPNTSESCVWPHCAVHCSPCAKTTRFDLCLFGGMCGANSQCLVAECYCDPGTCFAYGECVKANCVMGALPPKMDFNNDWILGWGMAPALPAPASPYEAWESFAVKCTLVPILILIVCMGLATGACMVLCGKCDALAEYLPNSPLLLVIVGAVSLLITSIGVEHYRRFVTNDLKGFTDDLDLIDTAFREARGLVDSMVVISNKYNVSMYEAVNTCHGDPIATDAVTQLVGLLEGKVSQAFAAFELMKSSLDGMSAAFQHAQGSYFKPAFQIALWAPMIPLALMQLLMLVVVVFVSVHMWCNPSASSNGWGKCLFPFMIYLVFAAALAAAIAFFVAVVVSGYCETIDRNIVDLAEKFDYEGIAGEAHQINLIVQKTARYYIEGTDVNPLRVVLANAESALWNTEQIYNELSWAVDLLSVGCPGLNELSPDPMLKSLMITVDKISTYIDAEHIWPLYDDSVHLVLCKHTPKGAMMLAGLKSVIGCFLFPLVAILANLYLKEMEADDDSSEEETDEMATAQTQFLTPRGSKSSSPRSARDFKRVGQKAT